MSAILEGWAIVELMGHRRLVGQVSEVEVAGTGMLRIEVPTKAGMVTQFVAPSAVYAITPTTEQSALMAAQINEVAPVNRWELVTLPARATPEGSEDDETY